MKPRNIRGLILKELREKKGLKQDEVAAFLGITQQAYGRYEKGTSEPNAEGFNTLADFYGVTTDYLLGREPLQYSIEEQELIMKYNKLDDFGKQAVNNVIKFEIERQYEDTCNMAAAFRIYLDFSEKYGAEKAIELMKVDPFADLDLRDEDEKEVMAKYMSLPPQMRAILLDALRQLGGVMIDANGEEQPALTREEYCGTLEDQINSDDEAQKDVG